MHTTIKTIVIDKTNENIARNTSFKFISLLILGELNTVENDCENLIIMYKDLNKKCALFTYL